MKKAILIVIELLFAIIISAQDIEGFVNRQLEIYPKSRLLDIYKSSFQDYMGAEHLISDRQRVKAYLDEELQMTSLDDLMPWDNFLDKYLDLVSPGSFYVSRADHERDPRVIEFLGF